MLEYPVLKSQSLYIYITHTSAELIQYTTHFNIGTDTYQLEVGSMEHRCAVEAASKKSKSGDVLCRTLKKSSESGVYTVKFEMKSMGPGLNKKYLEEGKEH